MIKLTVFSGTSPESTKYGTVVDIPDEKLPDLIVRNIYSPSVFVDGHRLNQKFRGTDLLVLDVDDGLSLEEAKEVFKDFKHIIATTRNHQKEKKLSSGATKPACDRFRVILFLDKRITDEQV
jgi:hypothetical protein